MKLFYKRDYELAKEIINDLQVLLDESNKEVDYLNNSYKELSTNYKELCVKNKTNIEKINDLEKVIELKQRNSSKLEKKVKELYGSKGGLTKRVNELEEIINTLEEENKKMKNRVADLESNRYLKIELPAEKPKKIKVMGIKRGVVSKGAKAILKSKNESKEKN